MVLTSEIFKGSWRCGYGPAAENEVIKIGSEHVDLVRHERS
jgi:hypothetical protein